MLRALVKTGGSRILHWAGVDRLAATLVGTSAVPMVIGYHRVVENFAEAAKTSIPSMLISRSMLERHLEWLARRYRLVSLDELAVRIQRGAKFDRPVAAITFDDGYRDNYDCAFPLLKRMGIPAAVFVSAGLIGTPRGLIHDRVYGGLRRAFSIWTDAWPRVLHLLAEHQILPALTVPAMQSAFAAARFLLSSLSHEQLVEAMDAIEAELGTASLDTGSEMLSWEMVGEMHREGILIGSHTCSHVLLTNENPRKIAEELANSRTLLEQKLGVSIRHFAYPDGKFNRQSVRAVAAAGYRYAYTICRHRLTDSLPLTIPRKLLWEQSCLDARGAFSSPVMSCLVNGVFDFRLDCGETHNSLVNEDKFSQIKKAGWAA